MNAKDSAVTRIALNEHNWFELRINIWDELAFGFRVTEVLEIEYEDVALLHRLDEENGKIAARLCCLRVDANDQIIKGDLFRYGFRMVECSWEMAAATAHVRTSPNFPVRPAAASDLPFLQECARNFRHSRFHEDPQIPKALADRRFENWVADLAGRGACLVGLDGGRPVGFVATSTHGGVTRMELTGIHPSARGKGRQFYSSCFDYLKPFAKKFESNISAANIAIANIYIALGFKPIRARFDYHKWYGAPPENSP